MKNWYFTKIKYAFSQKLKANITPEQQLDNALDSIKKR